MIILHTTNIKKTLTGFILGDAAPPVDDTDLPPPPPPESEDSLKVYRWTQNLAYFALCLVIVSLNVLACYSRSSIHPD